MLIKKIMIIGLLGFSTPIFAGIIGPICPPLDQPQPPYCDDDSVHIPSE